MVAIAQTATVAVAPLSAEQWSEVIRHAPLVNCVMNKFTKSYSPIARDELRVVFENVLITAVREYNPAKVAFPRWYFKLCRNAIGNWNKKEHSRNNFINVIRYDNSRYESYDDEYTEPLDIKGILEQSANDISLPLDKLADLIGYLHGNCTLNDVAAQWQCSREWVRQRLGKLLARSRKLCGVESEEQQQTEASV